MGKELATTVDDLAKRFVIMEYLIRPLQHLAETVWKLVEQVIDQGHQQWAMNLALLRLEQGDGVPPPQHAPRHPDHQGTRATTMPMATTHHRSPCEEEENIGDFLTTYHKLDFLKFDDSSDILAWLNRCEHYFCVRRMQEHKQVSYALVHLLNDMQFWFHHLQLNGGLPSWRRIVQLINTCLGPPLTDSPLGELALLHRSGRVDRFCNKSMSLSCRDRALTKPQ
jgi:hypothetical protein